MMSPASGAAPHDLPPAAGAPGGAGADRLRRTGIEVVGDVPWGTHFCQFYETAEDLADTLVPYLREGLLANEYCMWITSAPLDVEKAAAALRSAVPDLDDRIAAGQIEILDYREWYVQDNRFDADAVLDGWLVRLDEARRRGLEGLRLTADTLWLEEAAGWDDFYRYEEMIDAVFGNRRLLALCTYSLEKCGAREIVDVVDNHEFALVRRKGRWEILESAVQKRARMAIRESEDRFRSLFASMSEGVALHELVYVDGQPVDYRIVDANPAFEKNTAIPVEQSRGALASRLYGTGEPPFFEVYRRVAETGVPESFTEYFPPLDRHFRVSVVSTKPGTFATVFQDVTEIQRAEAALQEYAAELARSNEELERFAYVASHDLQEPLRSIVSFSQLLARRYAGKLDADADEFIGFIVEGGVRMQALIMDLLQLSRVTTTGKAPEATDASVVIGEVLRDLTGTIETSGATVTVGPMPRVLADPVQLALVFTNLVGNAIKYRRPEVPPEVRIEAERAGACWRFSVTDNGIGIAPEYYERIFVVFQRLHTREAYEGTGIGLAIVKKIVERHGGRAWVESVPGEGSTFSFTMAPA